eukprot:Gb_06750 [translate_table: standard]
MIEKDSLTLCTNSSSEIILPLKTSWENKVNLIEAQESNDIHQGIQAIVSKIKAECCTEDLSKIYKKLKLECSIEIQEGSSPTKSFHIKMPKDLLQECYQELDTLQKAGLLQESQSSWACAAFYVNKRSEQVRGKKRLVVNYKPLNKVVIDKKHPIPAKDHILSRLQKGKVFSKFDLKSGLWQLHLKPQDQFKTAFIILGKHLEWTVLPFGLKTAPSIFQHAMDQIFLPYNDFIIVYIDDILIFSPDEETNLMHLNKFYDIIINSGLTLSASKMEINKYFIHYLRLEINKGHIQVQPHVLNKIKDFPDIILDKTQLQWFMGCINYISGYYANIAKDRKILQARLRKDPIPWNRDMTSAVQNIKSTCQSLPPLKILGTGQKIIEVDASSDYWGAVLKEAVQEKEIICRYVSGTFKGAAMKYHSTHKEILAAKLAIKSFLFWVVDNEFILRSDLKHFQSFLSNSSREIPGNSRLARWNLWFSYFQIKFEHIPGSKNSFADFLS